MTLKRSIGRKPKESKIESQKKLDRVEMIEMIDPRVQPECVERNPRFSYASTGTPNETRLDSN